MKNAIVIMNMVGFPQIIPVENFSDENVKEALSTKMGVDKENLQCLTTGNPVIYGVKERHPNLESCIKSVQPYYAECPAKHFHYFHLVFATTDNQ